MRNPEYKQRIVVRNGLKVVLASGVRFAAGCSAIQENNDVTDCDVPDGVLTEATTDPKVSDYDPLTDPAVLASEMMKRAEVVQEENDQFIRNQIVGIGEVACKGDSGQLYLTVTGTQLSRELAQQEQ